MSASLLSPVFFQALETVQRAQLDPSAVDPSVQASLENLQEIFLRADLHVQEVIQSAQLQAAADEAMDGATAHPEGQGATQDSDGDAMLFARETVVRPEAAARRKHFSRSALPEEFWWTAQEPEEFYQSIGAGGRTGLSGRGGSGS
jgi:hypothetical protein